MTIEEALKDLESRGLKIDYKPTKTHGATFYHVDGMPRSEQQILDFVIHGTPMGA